jgi:riboflavin kinase/FMN adenylyltransferase
MNIPFTHQLSRISPKGFIELLYNNLKPAIIVTGPNYSFGYKGGGNPRMLVEDGPLYGFHTEIPEAVLINNTIVSSTLICKLIAEGNYEEAERFLERTLNPEIKAAV